jgi:hypothetical protein
MIMKDEQKKSNTKSPKNKQKDEHLSKRDLKDLMGENMQTLRRKRGGAWGN